MKCARFSHPSMPKVSINLLEKSLLVNTTTFHRISARTSPIYSKECFVWTLKRDQISIQFLVIQLLHNASKNFLMRRISETSSPIQFFIIKMFSTNSRQSKQQRRRRMSVNKNLQLKRLREPNREWQNWSWMSTSPNTDKIKSSSTRCLWTTLIICIRPMTIASRLRHLTQRLSLKGLSLSRHR